MHQLPPPQRVDLEVILGLRRSVLRAGFPDATVVFPSDLLPGAVHWATIADGEVVGITSAVPEARPGGDPEGFRVRMVGVDPSARRSGIGRALVEAAVAAVPDGREVWLSARHHLEGWYGAMGFVTVGPVEDRPPTGPHVDMVLGGSLRSP